MIVQTKEGEAPGDLIHMYKYLMEEKRTGTWTLPSGIQCKDRRMCISQTEIQEIPFKCRKITFIFAVKVVKHCNMMIKDVVESSPLKTLEIWLDTMLNNVFSLTLL